MGRLLVFRVVYASLLVWVLGAGSASATVIFSTLGPGGSFDTAGNVFAGPSYSGTINFPPYLANSFVAATTGQLTSIDLPLLLNQGSPAGVVVNIAASNGSAPGTILESSSVIAPSGADPQLVNALFGGSTLLTAGNTYWVWLGALGDAIQRWSAVVPGVTHPLFLGENGADGVVWRSFPLATRQAYRVNGVDTGGSVPVPSTLLLVAGGLLWFRRRLGIVA